MTWVPLHVHSQYSILDSSLSISALVEKISQWGLPACALTDHGNLFGAIDFYKACSQKNIKPIIGCEFYVAPTSRHEKKKVFGQRNAHGLVLLAKNQEGYRNLCALSSLGFLEGFYYTPRIDKELLKKYHKGLICLSGGVYDALASLALEGNEEAFQKELQWYRDLYGDDYYLEIQRHQMDSSLIQKDGLEQESWLLQQYQSYVERQKSINKFLISKSKSLGIKLVATNDTHYLDQVDWQAHEILLNVQSGEPCEIWERDSMGNPKFRVSNPKRRTYATHSLYLRSPQDMEKLFEDQREALSQTLSIADQCHLEIDFKTKHYPVFFPPGFKQESSSQKDRRDAVAKFLKQLCQEGIKKRYDDAALEKVKEKYQDQDPMQVVLDRLKHELDIIIPKGLADYLLIVWDFIHWAKKENIPVGPGRGSGAGSLVLFLIGITDIEPLRFNLFFERFINPERMSDPDIDVDICMSQRQRVIDYTMQKYGADCVAQIITFGTMKAKMALKDVGRVLSVPLSKVNAIAKLVPDDLNMTLEKALHLDPDLKKSYESDDDAKRMIQFALKLEGSIRNTGIHAAGVIISGEPLVHHIPICKSKDSEMAVTQYSMKPVESVGMLKVDFLGLKTLTCIQKAVEAIKKFRQEDIDWMALPLDDPIAFEVLNQGKTLGVFQMESSGMQDLARQLHLDRFEEIIAVLSLYRPGPMDMIPSFTARKHGREPIEYDHPWMEPILSETYGIMVYQEQVMQIACKLANFSLGEGDVLRRAMGKKDMEQMAQQREKFRQGAQDNEINAELSMAIFDKMERFAAYGFNKSHAAAYGYLTYVTAYLKGHYPKEWMAALMTCDRDDLSKVAKFIRECKSMNIGILPPDVNEAGIEFVAVCEGIRFAMSAVKGVGTGVVEAILEEREKNGNFKDLYDFVKRVDHKKVGKKSSENLIMAGAFDFTQWGRDAMRVSLDAMYCQVQRERKEKEGGVMSLFSLIDEGSLEKEFQKPPPVGSKDVSSSQDLLFKEKELLGFFLTGHPMDAFRHILKKLSCITLSEFDNLDSQAVMRSAFIVESVQVKIASKSQRKFAILRISDGIESFEMPIWPDLYEENSHLLGENHLIYAVLQAEKKEEGMRLTCHWLGDLVKVDEQMIQACDFAYDRAKFQLNRLSRKSGEPKKMPVVKKAKPLKSNVQKMDEKDQTLVLELDIQKLKFSEVLKYKEIFQEFSGKCPIKILFQHCGLEKAIVEISEQFGVSPDPALTKRLDALNAVLSASLEA